MSTAAVSSRRYTLAEYFALEASSELRHEYWDGQIFQMAGSTPNHDRIATELIRLLGNFLAGKQCEPFGDNIRVKVEDLRYVYPDISVAYGAEFETISGLQTLLNPVAVFEVLSPTTEAIDRGRKLAEYLSLPSLREYVLVSQEQMRVDHIVRTAEGWSLSILTGPEASLQLASIGCSLPLAQIYSRVQFPAEPEPAQ
jgi:Uma2 family endonuclease